jgi:hypothetical protein
VSDLCAATSQRFGVFRDSIILRHVARTHTPAHARMPERSVRYCVPPVPGTTAAGRRRHGEPARAPGCALWAGGPPTFIAPTGPARGSRSPLPESAMRSAAVSRQRPSGWRRQSLHVSPPRARTCSEVGAGAGPGRRGQGGGAAALPLACPRGVIERLSSWCHRTTVLVVSCLSS